MSDEDFCDSYCTWLDHHPDCKIPVGYLGVNKVGEIGKFRTSQFNGSMPLFANHNSQDFEKLRSLLREALPYIQSMSVNTDKGLDGLINRIIT